MESSTQDLNSAQLFDVQGLVAIVTGGGTGIGLMITRALVANGIKRVYIIGRRLDVLQTTAKEYGSHQIVPLQCDLTQKEEIEKLKNQVEAKEEYIDLLVIKNLYFFFFFSPLSDPFPKIDREGDDKTWWNSKTACRKVYKE